VREEIGKHKCLWKETWHSGDKYLYECRLCGRERKITTDAKYKKAVKDGEMLQPVGREKDAFLNKHGFLPEMSEKERLLWRTKHGFREN